MAHTNGMHFKHTPKQKAGHRENDDNYAKFRQAKKESLKNAKSEDTNHTVDNLIPSCGTGLS